MHIDEVITRAKNAFTAGLGAAGISVLSMYRTAQEMEYVASSVKILKMSGLFGAVAGVIWFFMPKAADSVEETINEVKQELKEPIAVMINRTVQEQKQFVQDIKARRFSTRTNNGSPNWKRPQSQWESTPSEVERRVVTSPATRTSPGLPPDPNYWKNYTDSYQRGFSKPAKISYEEEKEEEDVPGWDDIDDAVLQEELEEYMASLEDEDEDDDEDDDEYEDFA